MTEHYVVNAGVRHDVPQEQYTRYVWAKYTAHPVEHITHDSVYMTPLCGASIQRLDFDLQPTGFAPVCVRCSKKEAKS